MKLNEKQAETWTVLGEALLDVCARVVDPSLPDDVALDQAWMLRRMREFRKLVDRWVKTLPKARRKKNRLQMLMEMMPVLMTEAVGPGSKASVTYEGRTVEAEASAVSSEEPN